MRRKSKDRPLVSELRQRSAELGVDTMTGALLVDAADVIEAHERGTAQRALIEGLPLPPDVRAALAELAQLKAELSALRPLSGAGTQGEWRECNGYADGCCYLHSEATGRSLLMWDEEIDPRINVRADAEFIAAAVNAVRRMLARESKGEPPHD